MKNIPAKEALNRLAEGNKRYVQEESIHPRQSSNHRKTILEHQSPFAVVIGCSDSRVPPEILFDQGIGDLFVIRVAGTTVGNVCLGSIEYAVEHLGIELVLVLGHESCGVVKTAMYGDDVHHHLGSLVKTAQQAVNRANDMDGDLLNNAIHENVKILIDNIENTEPVIKPLVKNGSLKVVGGYYHLDSGQVDIIE